MGPLKFTKPGPREEAPRADRWRISWRAKVHPDPEAMRTLVSQLSPEERVVTHAAAIATKEARIRLTDRRLVILFLLVVGVGAWLLHNQSSHFDSFKKAQKATNDRQRSNCRHVQSAFGLVNNYFDGQEKIIRKRTDLSSATKTSLISNLERSKLTRLDCS